MKRSELPALNTRQMIEVDRLMIEVYGISLLQMMENAGRNLAEQALRMLKDKPASECRLLVLSGAGNNGGGGLAAARHLHNRGAKVEVQLLTDPEKLKEAPALQWRMLQNLGSKGEAAADWARYDLIIDALIGYGLVGNLRSPATEWVEKANSSDCPILSLDAPSGLDTSSGKVGKPCIRATATLTLALPKVGLLAEEARAVVGELFLADISVPPELYQSLGLNVPPLLFYEDSIIVLT